MNGQGKPLVVEPNPVLWQRLATFASNQGFRIPEATRLEDPRSQLAIDYLRKANPLSTRFSTTQVQRVVLAGILLEDPAGAVPELDPTHLAKERRFGRAFEPDLEEDKHYLFVPTIYQDQDVLGVNLYFVWGDLFRCIFGLFRFQVGVHRTRCSPHLYRVG